MFSYIPIQFAPTSSYSGHYGSRPAKRVQQHHPAAASSSSSSCYYHPKQKPSYDAASYYAPSSSVDPFSLLFGPSSCVATQSRQPYHHDNQYYEQDADEDSASSSSSSEDDEEAEAGETYSSCDEERQYYEYLDAKRREREMQELADIQAKRRAQEEAALLEAKRRKHAEAAARARAQRQAQAEAEARAAAAAAQYRARMEAEYRQRQARAEAEARARAEARANAIRLQRQQQQQQQQEQERRRIRQAYEEDLARQILWHSLSPSSPSPSQQHLASSSSSPRLTTTRATPAAAPAPRVTATTPTVAVRPIQEEVSRRSPSPGTPAVVPLPPSSSTTPSSSSTAPAPAPYTTTTMDYASAVSFVQTRAKQQIAVRKSLKSVGAVREKYEALKRELGDLSESLDIDVAKSLESDAPILQYTSRNLPFRQYEESLVRLLTSLDEISSLGSEVVKSERKNLVLEIEDELSRLDSHKIQLWQKFKKESVPTTEQQQEAAAAASTEQGVDGADTAMQDDDHVTSVHEPSKETQTPETTFSASAPTPSDHSASDVMATDAERPPTIAPEPEREPEQQAFSIKPSDSVETLSAGSDEAMQTDHDATSSKGRQATDDKTHDNVGYTASALDEDAEVESFLIPRASASSSPSTPSQPVSFETKASSSPSSDEGAVEPTSIPLPEDSPSPIEREDEVMQVEAEEQTPQDQPEGTSGTTERLKEEATTSAPENTEPSHALPSSSSTLLDATIDVLPSGKEEYQTHVEDDDASDSDTSFEML